MGRPAVEDPRVFRVSARCTGEEKERFAADARAAGVRESVLARARLFGPGAAVVGGPVASAGEVEAAVADAVPVVPSVPVEEVVARAASLSDRRLVQTAAGALPRANLPGLFWCPEPLCQQRSFSGGVCSVHGVALEKRS